MRTMYGKFGQMLNSLVHGESFQGGDFIDCCIKNHICPADAGELLYERLGVDGDELTSLLLK